LTSPKEIEKFIRKNIHLPGVPFANSISINGIDLGEVNAILLKKSKN
jgi:hypothetical protein